MRTWGKRKCVFFFVLIFETVSLCRPVGCELIEVCLFLPTSGIIVTDGNVKLGQPL